MTKTLEQQFAEAKSKQDSIIEIEASNWAAWLCELQQEFGPVSDILASNEYEDDHWTSAQKNLLFVLINLKGGATFDELKALLIKIGDVDDIWNLCLDHICWMFSMMFIDEEIVDKVLEDVGKCEHCANAYAVFGYQMVASSNPLTLPEVYSFTHSSKNTAIWSFVRMVETDAVGRLVQQHSTKTKEMV